MGPEDKDQFDDLLDGVLKRYGTVEPRVGLEGRILANLACADRQPRLGSYWVAWGFPIAGTLGMATVLLFLMRTPHFHQQPVAVHPPSAATQTGSQNTATAAHKPHRSSMRRPTLQPELANVDRRPSVFPSPHPLTEQERLLKAYVNNSPQEAALVAHEQAEREKELEAMGWKSTESTESN
jgi:hypothetical protein